MTVTDATHEHVDAVVDMIELFYSEPDIRTPKINRDKAEHILHATIDQRGSADMFFKIYMHAGLPVGFILAERAEDLWSDALGVKEFFIYCRPSYRGSFGMGRLLTEFKQWVDAKPCFVRVDSILLDPESTSAPSVFEGWGWKPRSVVYGHEQFEVGV